jgi:hypothetical protein
VADEPENRQGDDAGGTVGHDAGDDVSGDHAAWRDLVARLELPQFVDPVTAPWPARENLDRGPAGQPAPGSTPPAPAPTDSDPLTAAADRTEPAGGTKSGSAGSSAGTRSGQGAGPDRSRVIRPASFMPFAAEPAATTAPSQAGRPEDRTDSRPEHEQALAGEADYKDTAEYPDYMLDGALLGYGEDDDSDDRYIPPPVPSLPGLDPVARGAWTALFGGPGYLFVATLLSWQVPGWAELAAIIAFVAGFTILVLRLGDGPSRRDGPDQGAVV